MMRSRSATLNSLRHDSRQSIRSSSFETVSSAAIRGASSASMESVMRPLLRRSSLYTYCATVAAKACTLFISSPSPIFLRTRSRQISARSWASVQPRHSKKRIRRTRSSSYLVPAISRSASNKDKSLSKFNRSETSFNRR